MKILVLNATYRPKGTTTDLANSFMDGARTQGAGVEMVMLCEQTVAYCTNCLKCYGFSGEGVAPCSLQDDMDGIIDRIVAADGVLFASPVHNGFVTGLMTVFWERLSWRVARPSGSILKSMGIKTRIDNTVRALGSIVSAGGMPERLRKFCDDGTPWLTGNAPLMLHGQWVGDMYAGADLQHLPESEQDWRRIYHLRRLSASQKQRAHDLGIAMAKAVSAGTLKPVTGETIIHPALRWIVERVFVRGSAYRIAKE